MKWVNAVHCRIQDCPHRDGDTECCKKADIMISEAGCLNYIEAKKKKGTINEHSSFQTEETEK